MWTKCMEYSIPVKVGPRKSSKAIDKHVIIDFRDKNAVIARFCDINDVFISLTYIYTFYFLLYIFYFCSIDSHSDLSIAFLYYQ